MLTTDIEQRLADWPIDLLGAASLSLILASVAIFAYTLQRSFVSGKNVATTTGKGAEVVTHSLGYWRWPGCRRSLSLCGGSLNKVQSAVVWLWPALLC
uniref:hypothetical protein n=1 Tax=Providencia rettgeri TaxID=587 RepID=UPI0034E065C2